MFRTFSQRGEQAFARLVPAVCIPGALTALQKPGVVQGYCGMSGDACHELLSLGREHPRFVMPEK